METPAAFSSKSKQVWRESADVAVVGNEAVVGGVNENDGSAWTGFADRTPSSTYLDEMTVNGDVSPTDGIPTVPDLDQ